MIAIVRPLRTPQGTLVSPVAEGGASPMAPDARARTVGPFALVVHFDSTFAPGEAPRDLDVRSHPHIGIATVSYLFSGAITHRDGLGHTAEIFPGDVAWMVAGRGVVHSERMPTVRERGGRFHGLQIWVALADEEQEREPSFEIVRAADVPVSEAPGARVRRLLGGGAPAGAPGAAWLSDIELAEGAAFEAPASGQAALHVLEGSLEIDGRALDAGETATFADGDARRFVARQHVRAIGFGGDDVGPRYLWWNYLHSSKERIEQAKTQWLEKRWPLPADDREDVIPLPADHERPLRLLNAR
jgi:redox-sensitive bicupin YhaK (pirin superfamily)